MPEELTGLKLAIERAGFTVPEIPEMSKSGLTAPTTRKIRIEYLGQCRERENGEVCAVATTDAQNPWRDRHTGDLRYNWSVIIPEQVLKDFFETERKPQTAKQTYYQILCILEKATRQEIKTTYKRLSRQWHPDVCKEPDAQERFIEIKSAYEILADDQQRRRYDAGLFFEREAQTNQVDTIETGQSFYYDRRGKKKYRENYFRAPLRCGLLTVEGTQELSKFRVSKILDWRDIETAGRVLNTSWDKHTMSISVNWV
jgi:hypothetical protein